MKKLLFMVLVTILAFIPFTVVNAKTKAESAGDFIKELLNAEEDIYDAAVNYDDGTLDISWAERDSTNSSIIIDYSGNIIEYNPTSIDSYEKAEEYIGKYMFILNYLLYEALRENGYSQNEIRDFFLDSSNSFDYDTNGIQIEDAGIGEHSYTSPDGSSIITITPSNIKIDVSKANLITGAGTFTPPTPATTVESVVNALQNDESFIKVEANGLLYQEKSITAASNKITLNNKNYNYHYHYHSLYFEDDVLEYEDDEYTDYDDANNAFELHSIIDTVIYWALLNNGYNAEEIERAMEEKIYNLNYEVNGIEYKEISDYKIWTSDGGSTVEFKLKSVKVDLNKVNLKDKEVEPEKNPKTGDNLITFIILYTISIIGLIGSIIYVRKEMYNK